MNARALLLLGAVPFVIGAATLPRPDDACLSAYRAQVQPIFNANCVSCHQDAAPAGDLTLQATSAPASIFGVPSSEAGTMMRIAPGQPDASYLYRKLAGTQVEAGGNGERMPLGGHLANEDMQAVSAWIAACKPK